METVIIKIDSQALVMELGLETGFFPSTELLHKQETALYSNINQPNSEAAKLKGAISILKAGGVVAFPTETVYGLAANALDAAAVQGIFSAKQRPSDNPLIVHVSSIQMLESLLPPSLPHLPSIYVALINKFWPGPLTILLPKGPHIPNLVTASHDTVAVRMPSHPVALGLIAQCGFPLAAPSANTSGRPSPTLAEHVFADLHSRIPMIVDGGMCRSGLESTVVDALRNPPAILRPGGITFEQIRLIAGFENVTIYNTHFVDKGLEEAPTTPGMKYRHYTPNAEVVLIEIGANAIKLDETNCVDPECIRKQRCLVKIQVEQALATRKEGTRVGVLRAGSTIDKYDVCKEAVEIHLGATAEEIARNLFKGLRDLEQHYCACIIVEGIPDVGHGLAVMNRIRKASTHIIQPPT
ncbi:hypothetical protein BDV3_000083 [Batrachochytrium dendrobatidis]|uniref:Threonylcarbamoyl-AMP synthase n=1 Tax=Batrachochytrium dendrobatidis (strain JEL423) TaxID=403673 RepID=A0A177WAC1_BATDL|nr:hypothetical protein O5D80_004376 [Batrachochytrium dendrobatidis]KAK5668253.1 hypothetical protein QVD99_005289 [Batrachochytrium dendrobatidis]OAJ37029.1 Sua5/YciO/YrdC/YwlC family tRNA threonylcarbamoyl adenosine modification protein [Batrachochytrium dendrobatidis JEL423]